MGEWSWNGNRLEILAPLPPVGPPRPQLSDDFGQLREPTPAASGPQRGRGSYVPTRARPEGGPSNLNGKRSCCSVPVNIDKTPLFIGVQKFPKFPAAQDFKPFLYVVPFVPIVPLFMVSENSGKYPVGPLPVQGGINAPIFPVTGPVPRSGK